MKLGKALGIYSSEVYGWLDTIRKIRNTYAHSPKSIPFGHPAIVAELELLPAAEVHVQQSKMLHDMKIDQMSPGRARFIGVCFALTDLFNASTRLHGGKKMTFDIPNGKDAGKRTPLPEKFELQPREETRSRD